MNKIFIFDFSDFFSPDKGTDPFERSTPLKQDCNTLKISSALTVFEQGYVLIVVSLPSREFFTIRRRYYFR